MLIRGNFCVLIVVFQMKCGTAITNGRVVETEKRYVAYFLKAAESPRHYTAWLCGGSVVGPQHVLTSAACLYDVAHAYLIAGYNKYVPVEDLPNDECLKRKFRKVIRTFTPGAFKEKHLLGPRRDYWNWGDITIAMVDVPFDFHDDTYSKYCSYTPAAVAVNFLPFYEKQGTDVIAYGWGHMKYQRPINDYKDYNAKYLRYGSGVITSTSLCKSHTPSIFNNLGQAYTRYLICVVEQGKINERGEEINPYGDFMNGTGQEDVYRRNGNAKLEEEKQTNISSKRSLRQNPESNDPLKVPGICQNDHGGPLVTWRGGREVVVGVACMYTTTERMECRPPFGFTSTRCHNKFIACILWPNRPAENESPRRSGPLNHGYDRL